MTPLDTMLNGSITEMLPALLQLFATYRWFGVGAAAVMILLRVFRWELLQSKLPSWMQWNKWPKLVRWAVLFVVVLGTNILLALATGTPFAAALTLAIPVAWGAIMGHKTTEAIGHATTPPDPTPVRKALAPVLPLDREKLSIRTRLVEHSTDQ